VNFFLKNKQNKKKPTKNTKTKTKSRHQPDTRLAGSKHGAVRVEHGVVDRALVVGELAVGRVRARNVGAILVELAAHVEEANIAILDELVVVRIVERRARVTGGADAGVAEGNKKINK
jgi:hypothetical protein